MTKIDDLQKEIMQAMKDKDTLRLNVLKSSDTILWHSLNKYAIPLEGLI